MPSHYNTTHSTIDKYFYQQGAENIILLSNDQHLLSMIFGKSVFLLALLMIVVKWIGDTSKLYLVLPFPTWSNSFLSKKKKINNEFVTEGCTMNPWNCYKFM